MPLLYLHWFRKYFLSVTIPGSAPYVLQYLKLMKGTKPAGRAFYQLIKAILGDAGVTPTSIDAGFYVCFYKEKYLVSVVTETDDFLLSTNSHKAYNLVKNAIWTSRYIRASLALVWIRPLTFFACWKKLFGVGVSLACTDTPLCTDKKFDKEIVFNIPADVRELKQLERQFKGPFLSLYGEVQHIATASCLDFSNAMNRMGVFQAAPSQLGFEIINRVYCYLWSHPNVPLFYPTKPLTAESLFQSYKSQSKPDHCLVVPQCLFLQLDSIFAPFSNNRHSILVYVETIGTVAVKWKTTKQVTFATSASDTEAHAYFQGGCRTLKK